MKLIVILPKRFDQKNLNEPHRDLVQIEIQNISTNLNLSVALNKKSNELYSKKGQDVKNRYDLDPKRHRLGARS